MVDEIIANIRFPCSLPQLGLVNEYLSLHSVDVGVSSVLAGAALGYARKKLVRIAMCGFLHDIGKLKVNRRFLEKPGPLSPGEFEEVKRHTFYASELGICEDDVLRTAMQHHERYDGRGYPLGLSGEEIAEFSRIAKIADVFNAMTTDRVYRSSVLAGEALNYIREGAGTEFDAKIVRIFCRAFAFYPAGTLVRLPEGEVGVVTKNHPEAPLQPVVVLLFDKNDRAIDSREVDLLKSNSGGVKIICHSEVAGLLSKKRDLGRWFG